MNVYDGERMAELLGANGMTAAGEGEDADLVVLNTCHIREKAAEKAYSEVGRLRREDGSRPLVALAGCVAQAEGAEAKRRSSMIEAMRSSVSASPVFICARSFAVDQRGILEDGVGRDPSAVLEPAEEAALAAGVAGDAGGLLDPQQERVGIAVEAQLEHPLDMPRLFALVP